MTNPLQNPGRGGQNPGRGGFAALPTPPKGWPIGSYPTYAEAQRAVDHLSDQEFPVQHVTIVGVDLMQVERVTGRLTWPRVLGGGALDRAPGSACSSGSCSGSSARARGGRWPPGCSPVCSSA